MLAFMGAFMRPSKVQKCYVFPSSSFSFVRKLLITFLSSRLNSFSRFFSSFSFWICNWDSSSYFSREETWLHKSLRLASSLVEQWYHQFSLSQGTLYNTCFTGITFPLFCYFSFSCCFSCSREIVTDSYIVYSLTCFKLLRFNEGTFELVPTAPPRLRLSLNLGFSSITGSGTYII